MRYHTIEVNGKEMHFRLTVDEIESIEKRNNVKMLDYIQDYSITTMVFLLQNMYKEEGRGKLSHSEAQDLLEELFDNDYSLQRVEEEIILPCCAVSGLLTKSDLNKVLNRGQATQ